MKLIFSIAKNEFRYLFYSPVAWFVLIVFVVQCALFYSAPVLSIANYQEIMLKNSPSFHGFGRSLVEQIFRRSEFFSGIMSNLYLFIPILTMGLISREVNAGTNSLLYSSPVNLRSIVLGKYLGIMLYNLLLVLIIVIFLVTGFFSMKQPDYGPMLSAVLGFYLLVCTYSAIGLWLSCLSTYQIVSALGSFTVIFILSRIGELWQRYDFVRDLTYFLSLQNRTIKMLSGLVVTKDVIYFLLVTAMFVAFTLIRLSNNREAKPWYVKWSRYVAVMALVLMTGYFSSRPTLTGYWDVTATKRNTIHPKTQKLLKELGDSSLQITLYTNLLGGGLGHGLPEMRNADYLANLWEPYMRFKPDIKFVYEYYYDNDPARDDSMLYKTYQGKDLKQIAFENADAIDAPLSMFRTPEEMHRDINLQPENYRLVMQLKYRGRTAFLRTFDDPIFWPDETNVIATLSRLLNKDIPSIAFVSGELERSVYKTGEREYSALTASKLSRASLANIGFDADSINLATQDIPQGLDALVLSDPKRDLSPVVMMKLKKYTAEGGNLMITGEPGKQYVLNPFLSELGVQLAEGQIVQPTFDETPDKVVPWLTHAADGLSEGLSIPKVQTAADSFLLMMPGVTAVSETGNAGFTVDSLSLTAAGRTWLRKDPIVIDSILPAFNEATGDLLPENFSTQASPPQKGHGSWAILDESSPVTKPSAVQPEPRLPGSPESFSTSMKLTRRTGDKEQRILVFGDADFAGNMRINTHPNNGSFLIPCYSWITRNLFPVYTPRPMAKDDLLTIGSGGAQMQKIVFVWVLPSVLLLAGTILLIRRKRK